MHIHAATAHRSTPAWGSVDRDLVLRTGVDVNGKGILRRQAIVHDLTTGIDFNQGTGRYRCCGTGENADTIDKVVVDNIAVEACWQASLVSGCC